MLFTGSHNKSTVRLLHRQSRLITNSLIKQSLYAKGVKTAG